MLGLKKDSGVLPCQGSGVALGVGFPSPVESWRDMRAWRAQFYDRNVYFDPQSRATTAPGDAQTASHWISCFSSGAERGGDKYG